MYLGMKFAMIKIWFSPLRVLWLFDTSAGSFFTMSVSGLTFNPSRFFFRVPNQDSHAIHGQALNFPVNINKKVLVTGQSSKNVEVFHGNRSFKTVTTWKYMTQQSHRIKSAMDASFGDMADDSPAVFPRINIRDPYKRLGISREASEEEIQAARIFLINRYAGHKPSVDSIESAHNKIIMQQFHERRRPKLNIKKKVRDITQSRVVQAVMSRFQTPPDKVIVKTAAVFAILGVLTVLFPSEEGPTFQVAISLLATVYFIHDRLKSKVRALLYGIGAFGISWLLGTFLMVSVIPPIPILRGPSSLEVSTSLITYILLWVSSTYLK